MDGIFREGFGVDMPEWYGYTAVEVFWGCPMCGAVVFDIMKHEIWHDQMDDIGGE